MVLAGYLQDSSVPDFGRGNLSEALIGSPKSEAGNKLLPQSGTQKAGAWLHGLQPGPCPYLMVSGLPS